MIERLIEPQDYTEEIKFHIDEIKQNASDTLINITDNEIKVVEYDGIIYILGNPQLGTESVLNENGEWIEVPMYNITMMRDKDWIQYKWKNDKFEIFIKQPRLRIFRPDLCARLDTV